MQLVNLECVENTSSGVGQWDRKGKAANKGQRSPRGLGESPHTDGRGFGQLTAGEGWRPGQYCSWFFMLVAQHTPVLMEEFLKNENPSRLLDPWRIKNMFGELKFHHLSLNHTATQEFKVVPGAILTYPVCLPTPELTNFSASAWPVFNLTIWGKESILSWRKQIWAVPLCQALHRAPNRAVKPSTFHCFVFLHHSQVASSLLQVPSATDTRPRALTPLLVCLTVDTSPRISQNQFSKLSYMHHKIWHYGTNDWNNIISKVEFMTISSFVL